MIISTTIDLSPDVYSRFMSLAENTIDMTPEELISVVLTVYASKKKSSKLSTAEKETLVRLRLEGMLPKYG